MLTSSYQPGALPSAEDVPKQGAPPHRADHDPAPAPDRLEQWPTRATPSTEVPPRSGASSHRHVWVVASRRHRLVGVDGLMIRARRSSGRPRYDVPHRALCARWG